MKVVVGASSFASDSDKAINLLLDKGIEVVKNPYGRKMTEEEIIAHLQGADGLLAGLEPLNDHVFEKSPKLKAIARIGIGMDNVDRKAAEKYGIKVSNTPEGPTNAVAEMTLAALLAIGHQIVPANKDIHNKVWKKRMGFSLDGLNILVIGYGHIGRKAAELLGKFNVNLMIYDKFNEQVSTCRLEEGIKAADVITLHASGKDEILSADLLQMVKDGVVILNSARGALINEDALYEGLTSGKIAWFWGDALWEEPYQGKVISCENAILTPHICTYTKNCREDMETQAVQNLLEDLQDV